MADQGELYQRIGQVLAESLPAGWQDVEVTCYMIDFAASFRGTVTDSGGQQVSVPLPGGALTDLFAELRGFMYEPEQGTWYTAVFRLDVDGRFTVDFDYDAKPELTGVLDEDYLEDLEKYPREPDRVPSWMPRSDG